MANAKKCDFCGILYEKGRRPKWVLTKTDIDDELDLCPQCQERLKAWVKSQKAGKR